jgi:hypothetical protein
MNQPELQFPSRLQQEFNDWKQTPGGAEILRIAYAITARYAARYLRTGRRVSIRLIWENLRDNVTHIRARRAAFAHGLSGEKGGFTLNDHHHAYLARHILNHKPQWSGLFELRKTKEI